VIDVQREISERVANELHVALSGKERMSGRGTDNAEAWALRVRAKSLMEYPYGSDLPKAQTLLEEAVRLDPDYAEAWAHLGAVHMQRTLWNEPTYDLSLRKSLEATRDAIDRSQAADPDEGWALIVLAGLKWAFEDDISLTARLTEQAVQRQPWNLNLLIFAADIARSLGDLEQARELASYVLERDPLCSWCRISLLTTLLALEDYETLERESNLAMQVTPRVPDNRYLLFFLGRAQLLGDNPAAATATFRQIPEDSDMHLTGLAMANHTLGNELESARYQEMLFTRSPGHASMTSQVAAWHGDYERAFEFLDLWVEQRGVRVTLQTNYLNPVYKSLHTLPGWQRFLESIGRSPEQIGDIGFNALRYLETADDLRP
jgi:tetratricopeptide (TPR) repeat protein